MTDGDDVDAVRLESVGKSAQGIGTTDPAQPGTGVAGPQRNLPSLQGIQDIIIIHAPGNNHHKGESVDSDKSVSVQKLTILTKKTLEEADSTYRFIGSNTINSILCKWPSDRIRRRWYSDEHPIVHSS